MPTTATLNGAPTEDAALGYTLDPAGATVVSQAWESSTDGTNWTAIAGATGATFTPGDDEVGKFLRVVVQVDEGSGPPSPATSNNAVVANVNDTPVSDYAISGTAKQGEGLRVDGTVTDGDGTQNIDPSYQWQVDDGSGGWTDIAKATSPIFTLTQAEVGRLVRAAVSYTDDQGTAETVFTAATTTPVADTNDAPTGSLTISGTATQGQKLATKDDVTDPDGATGDRSYKWQSSADGNTWTDIADATGTEFTLTQATVNRFVRAAVSFTDDRGTAETVFSDATATPIADANIAPGGSLTVEGTLKVGQTVNMADLVFDEDGIAPDGRSYQWQASADGGTTWANLEGASGNTPFLLTEAQRGQSLRAVLTYTDGDGKAETVLGTASAPVAAAGNSAPTGTVVLDDGPGDAPRKGVAVTADASGVKDADGLGALTYAWSREAAGGTWTAIQGANGASYTPGDADVGARLKVEASYTDGGGTRETVSAVSAAVAAAPAGKAIALPPPEPGETRENAAADEWTSVDLARMIAEGGTFTPPAGLDRVELADGVLSYGTGTTEAFVARLYLGLLGREGDVGGLSFAAEALENGASRGIVAGALVSSAEYKALRGAAQTDAAFVDGLYDAFLGRDGAAGELGFWTAAMANGASGGEVAAAIAGSAEAGARMGAATNGVFVADFEGASARGLYKCALGREGEAAGVRYWADALEQGADLKALGDAFDDAPEFTARHGGLTNRQYVEKLYQDGLGRAADAGGLEYWTGLLDSGRLGRGELAVFYATSQEVRDGLDWLL